MTTTSLLKSLKNDELASFVNLKKLMNQIKEKIICLITLNQNCGVPTDHIKIFDSLHDKPSQKNIYDSMVNKYM